MLVQNTRTALVKHVARGQFPLALADVPLAGPWRCPPVQGVGRRAPWAGKQHDKANCVLISHEHLIGDSPQEQKSSSHLFTLAKPSPHVPPLVFLIRMISINSHLSRKVCMRHFSAPFRSGLWETAGQCSSPQNLRGAADLSPLSSDGCRCCLTGVTRYQATCLTDCDRFFA